jgi:predicted secreted protein
MPIDARSWKVAFVAHCLLNQNAKVAGVAGYAGMFEPVVDLLNRHRVGIIQMPCPELRHLGPGRPVGTDTRDQYDTPAYRVVCRRIAHETVAEAKAYMGAGYTVLAVLGVEGSPSCAVTRTPRLVEGSRALTPGQGLFTEALRAEFREAGLDEIPFLGIPESEDAGDLEAALAIMVHILEKNPH